MKIDFLSGYKQVQKLVDARPNRAEEAVQFDAVLEALNSDKGAQVPEINSKIDCNQNLSINTPRARFDFEQAELLNPQPQAIGSQSELSNTVNETANSVKTPTGLDGKLVKVEDPFSGLSRAETKKIVGRLVSLAGLEHGIDPALSLGVIKAESNFNPVAVSSDGHESKGLMQLLDSTGKEMMSRLGVEENYTPFNPEQNVELGVAYLRRLHDVFGTSTDLGKNLQTYAAANSSSLEKLAVAAYNAGEGRVASAQQRAIRAGKDPSIYENVESYLPDITQQYVKKVISTRNEQIKSNQG